MSPFGEPSSPSLPLSLAPLPSRALTPATDSRYSDIGRSIDRSGVHRSPLDHPLIHWIAPCRVGVQRSRLSLTAGNALGIRFSVCSEPRAELRLQNRGCVGPAHYSEVVQQIRHRRRLPVPRFPQIQNVLGRAGLGREVIDVPVTGNEDTGCVITVAEATSERERALEVERRWARNLL